MSSCAGISKPNRLVCLKVAGQLCITPSSANFDTMELRCTRPKRALERWQSKTQRVEQNFGIVELRLAAVERLWPLLTLQPTLQTFREPVTMEHWHTHRNRRSENWVSNCGLGDSVKVATQHANELPTMMTATLPYELGSKDQVQWSVTKWSLDSDFQTQLLYLCSYLRKNPMNCVSFSIQLESRL